MGLMWYNGLMEEPESEREWKRIRLPDQRRPRWTSGNSRYHKGESKYTTNNDILKARLSRNKQK